MTYFNSLLRLTNFPRLYLAFPLYACYSNLALAVDLD